MALPITKLRRFNTKLVSTLIIAAAFIVQPFGALQVNAASTITICDVSCSADSIQATINSATAGDTIALAGDATISHQITINKSLTFSGNGHTITPTFVKTDGSNNAALGIIETEDVTISNLTIDGSSGTALHGINAYASTVLLDNVTTRDNDRDGLVANGSSVTVNNLSTSGNGWGGVDVDLGSGVTRPAVLTINGVSSHSEASADIRIDNTAKAATVIDTNNQYNSTDFGTLRVYELKPAAPQNLRFAQFACGGATNVNFISPTWDAVVGATSYNYRVTLPNGSVHGPVNVGNVTSVSGAFGGTGLSAFSVQAVTANGPSNWSPDCAVTYDTTAPTTPTLLTPTNNSYKSVNDFYFDWTDSSDALAVTYEFQSSQNPAATGGVLSTGVWNNITNGNSEQNNLTASSIHSVGANGVWYWQVRAIDAAGNKSAWTPVWKMTIDMDAPQVSLVNPADNATVNGASLTQSWSSTSTDIHHYIYESYNNASMTSLRWSQNMGTSTSKTATNVANSTFWWRVKAVDNAGNQTWSPLRKLTVNNPVPAVNAEDFGVGSWTLASDGFTGVNVGFNIQDFKTVSGITVDLYDASGMFITNTASTALLNEINTNGWDTLSTPFVVSGILNDTFCAGGPCWISGVHTWTTANKPVKAVITVTGKNVLSGNVTKTAQNTMFTEAASSFAAILPIVTPAQTTTNLPSGNTLGASTTNAAQASNTSGSSVAQSDSRQSDESAGDSTEDAQTVLGTETTSETTADDTDASTSVLSDDATSTTDATNFAWFWWLIAAVAAIAAAWWFIAARRRSHDS